MFEFNAFNCFCISLSQGDRWIKMQRRLQNTGLEVTRIPASIAGTSDIIDPFVHYLNDGQKGCAQSHIRLWRHILDQNLPYALILEDDACFDKNWRETLNLLTLKISESNSDKWDLIMLNASEPCEPIHQWVPCKEQYLTAGYILSLNGAKKVLEMFQGQYYASDWMISRLQLYGQSYCYFPWLIIQEGNESTIGSGYKEDHIKVIRCLNSIQYNLDHYDV